MNQLDILNRCNGAIIKYVPTPKNRSADVNSTMCVAHVQYPTLRHIQKIPSDRASFFTAMFRQLFRPATVVLAGAMVIMNIPTAIVCSRKWSPNWVYNTAYQVGMCPPRTAVTIPSLMTSYPLEEVVSPVSRRMPDTTAMSNHRLGMSLLMSICSTQILSCFTLFYLSTQKLAK